MPVLQWWAPAARESKAKTAKLHRKLFGHGQVINGKPYTYQGLLGTVKFDGNGFTRTPLPTVEFLSRHDGIVRIESKKLAEDAKKILDSIGGIRYEIRRAR